MWRIDAPPLLVTLSCSRTRLEMIRFFADWTGQKHVHLCHSRAAVGRSVIIVGPDRWPQTHYRTDKRTENAVFREWKRGFQKSGSYISYICIKSCEYVCVGLYLEMEGWSAGRRMRVGVIPYKTLHTQSKTITFRSTLPPPLCAYKNRWNVNFWRNLHQKWKWRFLW